MADTFGDSGQCRPFCEATPTPGVRVRSTGAGGGGCQAGGGTSLQRQVGAVVPGFPGGAIVAGQSPLQVGHGHGLFEVNHSIGV